MKRIGSYLAKTHFAELLAEVANGGRITITKHGVPVAMLVPVQATAKHNAVQAAQLIRSSKRHKLPKGTSIKNLIEEGRTY
ncbi:MAG: type II toxin-antitoxin system prevent-host-death family antitoxin [Candidatus Obscuribacterales bacterium]|nr:type II toxin-antitoxin system prevent-host-death family antitoxin [Candidatus Obscuribacterales bacterium]